MPQPVSSKSLRSGHPPRRARDHRLGIVGITIELLFINHHEDAAQVIPLVLAARALGVIAWTTAKPGVVSLRALQFVMLAFIGAGITGITLHFQANAEFQREIDPDLDRMALVWKVVEATAPRHCRRA